MAKIVVATRDWTGFGLAKGDSFTLIRRYFANGEGHYEVRTADGTVLSFPEVFFW